MMKIITNTCLPIFSDCNCTWWRLLQTHAYPFFLTIIVHDEGYYKHMPTHFFRLYLYLMKVITNTCLPIFSDCNCTWWRLLQTHAYPFFLTIIVHDEGYYKHMPTHFFWLYLYLMKVITNTCLPIFSDYNCTWWRLLQTHAYPFFLTVIVHDEGYYKHMPTHFFWL